MGSIGGVISSLSSLAAKLLPGTSSSYISDEGPIIEQELQKLMRTLERIKETLYDAEEREIRDRSVKLWLKELKEVAYAAENVLDEYQYEILRVEVEARNASAKNSRKRKKLELPKGMADRIKKTMNIFNEIANHRDALQLCVDDGPRRLNDEMRITPTSYMVVESNIFGREREKEELVAMICSDHNNGDVVSVLPIVGLGGLGKTTVAQLVYNDPRVQQKFELLSWVFVSEDFSVVRLTKEVVESVMGDSYGIKNLSVLQANLQEIVAGRKLFLVLDDVWNEKRSDWELFQTPFLSAKLVKILVTTRNEPVARIMQTIPSFYLGNLSKEQCWQLFQQYAFGGGNCNDEWKLKIGKLIIKKCGVLPLAVKSVASLLRHEAHKENWREILESELWELESTKDIFPPLQISYSRLPTFLKPCLLYCSMFPKDYEYNVEELTYLWFAQGYIESKPRKTIEMIGREYAEQLFERSFFDCKYNIDKHLNKFKLHDMIHDLARSNLGNECYSIEYGRIPIFHKQIYHLYVDTSYELAKHFPSGSFTALRTLITVYNVENTAIFSDISETNALRTFVCRSHYGSGFLNSIGNRKHLRYISLQHLSYKTLHESICSLYNLQIFECSSVVELPSSIGNLVSLQILHISHCSFQMFPESICFLKSLKALKIRHCNLVTLPEHTGNLASLEELQINFCDAFRILPDSFCQLKTLRKLYINSCLSIKMLPHEMGNLTNLQTLIVRETGIRSLPPSMNKLTGIQMLDLELDVMTSNSFSSIGWLKYIVDLQGTLCFTKLRNMTNLNDARLANIMNKHSLESLCLIWDSIIIDYGDSRVLTVNIENGDNNRYLGNEMDLSLLESLQPHSNLQKLQIDGYCGITFPEWIGDPILSASLKEISLENCKNITFLPFSNLNNLKHMEINKCSALISIQAEFVPSHLQKLVICNCEVLISVPGIQMLKSLVELKISGCPNLISLFMEPETYLDRLLHTNNSRYLMLFIELTNLTSLRSLGFSYCPKLGVMANELLPVESCQFMVCACPKLKTGA